MTDRATDLATNPTAPGRLRWPLRLLLIGSLAINLLVFGVIVGGLVSGRFGGGPPRGIDLATGPFVQALEEADRQAIRSELRDRHALRPPSPLQRIRDLRALLVALRADPFDPAQVAALLDAQSAQAASALRAGQEALLARLAAMDPAARLAFADRLEAELRDRRRPDGRRDD